MAESATTVNKVGTVLAKKLKALEDGKMTDCVFHVGPDDKDVHVIQAFKTDLIVSSEYFAGLLRSPLTPPGPIRIKHVQPDVFKLVVEFTHINGQLVSNVGSLEICLQLAEAADEFMINDLGQLCTNMLNRCLTMENVWETFDKYHRVKFVDSACTRLLCLEPERSLQMPSFLKIGEETLTRFLKMEKMNISSELWLIRACLQYARANEREEIFRRTCLPHLRLLTLKAPDLSEVSSFLTSEEKTFLAQYQKRLVAEEELVLLPTLCPITTRRNPQEQAQEAKIFTLIPDSKILDLKTVFQKGKFCKLTGKNKFVLSISTTRCVRITGLDIFCKLDIGNDDFFNDNMTTRISEGRTSISYKNNMQVKVTVESNGCQSTRPALHIGKLMTNSLVHIDLSILNVPKGSRFSVEVILNGDVCIRKVQPNFFLLVKAALPFVHMIGMQQSQFDVAKDKFVNCEKQFCIIKNIHYTLV